MNIKTFFPGAIKAAFIKLDPRHQARNPVMFVVLAGSVFTTVLGIQALLGQGEAPAPFILAISAWLWFTVLFGNFAEAMAEGRGKAQAETLRESRGIVNVRKLAEPRHGSAHEMVSGASLRKGAVVMVEAVFGVWFPKGGTPPQAPASF